MSIEDEIIDYKENFDRGMSQMKRILPKYDVVSSVDDSEEPSNKILELPEGFSGDLYDSDYDDAVALYAKSKFDEVIIKCNQKDPQGKNAKYVALLGNCYYKQENISAAVEKWKNALELDSSLAEPYVNLGNYEYSKNNINSAIRFWLTATSIKPECLATNVNLGVAFGEKNLRYESLKYFDKYLRYAPETNTQKYNEISTTMDYFMNTAKKSVEKAEEAVKEGKINKAVQYYMYAIENYPMQVKAPYSLGNIFYNDKNYEKALYYWTLCRKSPKVPQQLMLNIAKAYDRLKLYDSAYCFYSRYLPFIATATHEYNVVKSRLIQLSVAFSKNPLVVDAHLTMAEKAEEDCDYFKAIEEYENYVILSHKETEQLKKKITNLKMCYNPEGFLITLLIKKIEAMKDNEIGELIIPMCNRIMLFSEQNSKEYLYALSKKNALIRRGK